FAPADELPAGVSAHPIGKPRRYETPLLLPSHRALVFADAIAGTDQGPRIWSGEKVDERVARFYAERFVPTLLPLLALDFTQPPLPSRSPTSPPTGSCSRTGRRSSRTGRPASARRSTRRSGTTAAERRGPLR